MEQLDHLIKKHRELDQQIANLEQVRLDARTREETAQISILKKKKLRLKDQINVKRSST